MSMNFLHQLLPNKFERNRYHFGTKNKTNDSNCAVYFKDQVSSLVDSKVVGCFGVVSWRIARTE